MIRSKGMGSNAAALQAGLPGFSWHLPPPHSCSRILLDGPPSTSPWRNGETFVCTAPGPSCPHMLSCQPLMHPFFPPPPANHVVVRWQQAGCSVAPGGAGPAAAAAKHAMQLAGGRPAPAARRAWQLDGDDIRGWGVGLGRCKGREDIRVGYSRRRIGDRVAISRPSLGGQHLM